MVVIVTKMPIDIEAIGNPEINQYAYSYIVNSMLLQT